jgi:hypothetical protein
MSGPNPALSATLTTRSKLWHSALVAPFLHSRHCYAVWLDSELPEDHRSTTQRCRQV